MIIELTIQEAAAINAVLQELGHPKGPFGEQHLLTAAIESICKRTMIPVDALSEHFVSAVHNLRSHVEAETAKNPISYDA